MSINYLLQLGFTINDIVMSSTKILVNGIEFSENFYVVPVTAEIREDKSLLFGCIEEIIHLQNQADGTYLLTSVYTSMLEPYMNAHRIEIKDPVEYNFIKISELPYYKTLCTWRKRTSNDVFISLRYTIV